MVVTYLRNATGVITDRPPCGQLFLSSLEIAGLPCLAALLTNLCGVVVLVHVELAHGARRVLAPRHLVHAEVAVGAVSGVCCHHTLHAGTGSDNNGRAAVIVHEITG